MKHSRPSGVFRIGQRGGAQPGGLGDGPSGVQGQSPDRRYGGRSPPETERFFEIDMNFDGFGAKLNAKITDSVPKFL